MAARSAKRYYFVQISNEKFFNNVRVKALEKDGADFVLSFERLILEALKDNDPGFLKLDPAFDSIPEQIATMLSCDMDYAERFYDALIKRQLCKTTEFGLWIPLSKELTASRTEKADEVKKRREAVKKEEALKQSYFDDEEDDDDDVDDEPDDDNPTLDDVEVVSHDGGTKEENCSPYIKNKEAKKEEPKKVKKAEAKSPRSLEVNKLRKEEVKSSKEKSSQLQKLEKPESTKSEQTVKEPTKRLDNHKEEMKPVRCSTAPQRKNAYPEIKEADSEKEEPAGFLALCERVVGYLNKKVGFKWHAHNKLNKEAIKERLAEGFTEEDFMAVVDVKTPQWKDNDKMHQYLRPITLFGPKMDIYLQETLSEQVCDPNRTSFRMGNSIFNGKGHILRGPDVHRPADPDFVKPKSLLGGPKLCTQ